MRTRIINQQSARMKVEEFFTKKKVKKVMPQQKQRLTAKT
jgi:hypothetical protein